MCCSMLRHARACPPPPCRPPKRVLQHASTVDAWLWAYGAARLREKGSVGLVDCRNVQLQG